MSNSKYQLVTTNTDKEKHEYLEILEKKVNSLMREGWEPMGGIMSMYTGEMGILYQAMVLPKNNSN